MAKSRIDETTIGVNADLTALAREQGKQYVDDHVATEADAIGLIIARHYEWDGSRIMEAFASALEDGNYHDECETVRNWLGKPKEPAYEPTEVCDESAEISHTDTCLECGRMRDALDTLSDNVRRSPTARTSVPGKPYFPTTV